MTSTEAPRSVNFYGVTKMGWNCQFTIRSVDNDTLLSDMGDLIKKLEALGVTPKQVGKQPDTPVSQNTPPPTKQEAAVYDTFDAEELVGSMNKGNTYWKVKGGKFSKYGVTIWPEVLAEAGFNVDALDPAQVYSLDGYEAMYITKEDGKPDKVVKLEK